MARRAITQYFDDLDQTPLSEEEVEVVRFSIDGTDYTLDVSKANAEKFHTALAPFIEAAHKLTKAEKKSHISPSDVREWARGKGYDIAHRGKIPTEVVDAYKKAHKIPR